MRKVSGSTNPSNVEEGQEIVKHPVSFDLKRGLHRTPRPLGNGSLHFAPPIWHNDDSSTQCSLCGIAFSFLKRRHHCRSCGKLFCGGCSSNYISLPMFGIDKQVRVCDSCFSATNQVGSERARKFKGILKVFCPEDSACPNKSPRSPRYSPPGSRECLTQLDEDPESELEDLDIDSMLSAVTKDGRLDASVLEQVNHSDVDIITKEFHVMGKESTDRKSWQEKSGEWEILENSVLLESDDIPSLRITMLVVGSRGDVQPFVAFGMTLQEHGHKVRLATHACFREFVEKHGLEFYPLAGDPRELMALMVENNMLSIGFLKEGISTQRTWVRNLLETCWRACSTSCPGSEDTTATDYVAVEEYQADCIIANPPSFAGPHIAEKLGIPLQMAFTMPWTRTVEFRSPFVTWTGGGSYMNYYSYAVVDRMIWLGSRDIVNSWRAKTLNLPPLHGRFSGHRILHDKRVPFSYCYSKNLLPKPPDWGAHISVCGYWFLEDKSEWTPDEELQAFLDAGSPPVFVGFGSIVVQNPNELTNTVLEALKLSKCRAIVQKGWAGMEPENVSSDVMFIGSAPHDKLFPLCSAVVHHGGAGTTAAGLKAGKPTVVVPFFGDQFFWGRTVAAMGVGPEPVYSSVMTAEALSHAINFCFQEQVKYHAMSTGRRINEENGLENGVSFFQNNLPLDHMVCDVDKRHLAKWYCKQCGFKYCSECEAIVHSIKIENMSAHKVQSFRWIDWASPQPTYPSKGTRLLALTKSGLLNGISTDRANVETEDSSQQHKEPCQCLACRHSGMSEELEADDDTVLGPLPEGITKEARLHTMIKFIALLNKVCHGTSSSSSSSSSPSSASSISSTSSATS